MRSQRGTGVSGDFRPVRAAVNRLQPAAPHVFHDLRHDFLGLAENEVLNLRERLVAGGEQRAAGNDGFTECRAPRRDFTHRFLLHDHGADQHVIRPAQVLVLEPLDVHVHQLEFPLRREHGGHRQQAQRRQDALRETKRTACLKLQNVSGVCGLTRSIFISTVKL